MFNKKKNSPSDFAGTKESEGFEPWDDEDEDAMEEVELGEVEADEEALEDVAQKALEAEPLTSEQQEEAQFMITKVCFEFILFIHRPNPHCSYHRWPRNSSRVQPSLLHTMNVKPVMASTSPPCPGML
ncbi:MAG: hypothetical protein ACREHG_07835 [Candidatus Saccharimonadales bacterium]